MVDSNGILSVENFDDICRTCLGTDHIELANDTILLDILTAFTSIQMEAKDSLPKKMCTNCIEKLYDFHNFIENCKQSNATLIEILKKSSEEAQEIPEVVTRSKRRIKHRKKSKRPYIKTMTGPPFVCVVCQQSFNDYKSLKDHRVEMKHRKAKKFICSFCGHPHESNSKLQEHMRIHTGEKPNECNICKKKFNFKVNLKRHMNVHTNNKPYSCKFCKKGFTRKQYAMDHERIHTGERLICTYCGRAFASVSNLYSHEKIHQSPDVESHKVDNSYRCPVCDKILRSEMTLKSHLLLHGPRNFNCEKCGKTYINKARLRDHFRFAHRDIQYPCSLCDKVYKSKGGLSMHKKLHNGTNSYNCEICEKHFTCKGSLRQHMRLHTGDTTFQCVECCHVFVNKRHLENHMRVHTGEKPFTCDYCGKAFAQKVNLTAHVRLHTGEKRHVCPKCGKGFYDGRGLRKHMCMHLPNEDNVKGLLFILD